MWKQTTLVYTITWCLIIHQLPLTSSYKDCRDVNFDDKESTPTIYHSVSNFVKTSDGKSCKIIGLGDELQILRSNQLNADPRAYYIRKLDLSGNEIGVVESDPFRASGTCLVVLDLSNNSITTISNNAFTALNHLQKLDLSRNQISNFNGFAFSRTNKLDVLNLEHNQLEDVSALDIFKNLTVLNLSYNKLKLKAGVFQIFPKLRGLIIEYNNFGEIPLGTFEGLGQLEELKIGGNNIHTFTTGVFSSVKSLNILNVSNNALTTDRIINEKVLFPISKLRTIILDGNNLVDLDSELINRVLPNLHYIGVGNMPWDCDKLLVFFKGCQRHFIDMSRHTEGTFRDSNIHGVRCREKPTTTSTTPATIITSTTTEEVSTPRVTAPVSEVTILNKTTDLVENETVTIKPSLQIAAINTDETSNDLIRDLKILFTVLIVLVSVLIGLFLLRNKINYFGKRFYHTRYVNKYTNNRDPANISEPECNLDLI